MGEYQMTNNYGLKTPEHGNKKVFLPCCFITTT
jgi:hypothetical protein